MLQVWWLSELQVPFGQTFLFCISVQLHRSNLRFDGFKRQGSIYGKVGRSMATNVDFITRYYDRKRREN